MSDPGKEGAALAERLAWRSRLIEVAARALYEHDETTMLHERCPAWDEVEESSREHYREDLAPVVDALIGHLSPHLGRLH